MVFCTELVRKRLYWSRSGEEFILKYAERELCRMRSSPVSVDCGFGGKGFTIRKKGLLKPRVEINTVDGNVGSIPDLNTFEPVLKLMDGISYSIHLLNDSGTALAFFGKEGNLMEFTDVSTWSEPRTELVVNHALPDTQAKTLMALGHYLLMSRRNVLN